MADAYNYIEQTGTMVPDTSSLLSDVQEEFKGVFGQDLIVTPDTPQGVIATSEALSREAIARNNAALANQINPNLAGGVFLDAICALTGIKRIASTRTTVTATLSGRPGTIVPEGSMAQTSVGDVFESVSPVIIGSGGSTDVVFQSQEYGPIPCAAGALSQIITSILGWETISNTLDATPGKSTQSDQELRAFRKNTLAFQGVSLLQAISSALYATEGVKSLKIRENTAATTQTIDGISMVAHSIYACVDGGTDSAVAATLLENKSSGSAFNGTTTVNVVEPTSGQTYQVKFSRPSVVNVMVKATIKNGTDADVKSAILAYANGEMDGELGFKVGESVSSFELAGAINRMFPSIYVQKVELSLTSPVSYSTNEIAIGINEIAYTSASLISTVMA